MCGMRCWADYDEWRCSRLVHLRRGPSVTSEAVAVTVTQAVLGEGLRWDARRDEILAVDILAGVVDRGRVDDDGDLSLVRAYHLPGTVGAVVPVQNDEGWVLAAERGFA